MHLIALGTAGAIVTILSFGADAADLFYPPSAVETPQYSVAPPRAVAHPQVLVVPGAPSPVPITIAPVPPPVVGSSPYGEGPPVVAPNVTPGSSLPPRAACEPVWRCGIGGCGWEPSCAPQPEHYAGSYRSPGPPVYPEAPRPPEPYARPNGGPTPQIYSGPAAPPPYSDPYAPRVYSGPTGRMRWMIGPQRYGM
jgi:hypothetical protein